MNPYTVTPYLREFAFEPAQAPEDLTWQDAALCAEVDPDRWANCARYGPAVTSQGVADGTPMSGGLAFARFMRQLGAGSRDNPGPSPDVVKAGC